MKDLIEEYLERFEVPGASVVIVDAGEVAVNAGFGVRDLSTGEPVDNRTSFAIASATKAFTVAGVAALVDDGLVEWDAPVRDYLPGFTMHDPVVTERLTVRDLLCHRSGLPRHDLLWYRNEALTKADLVERLRHLPLSRDLRTTWQYNNLMYSTAGHLCEVLTGHEWEDHVRQRILEPLGMTSATFSPDEARELGPVAVPHSERDDEFQPIPYARKASASGPAGAIYAHGDDMSRWLLANLDGGRIDGEQVLSEAVVAEMQAPQMATRGERAYPEVSSDAYGLGWFLGTYRGHRLVHHGGNIDGFTALVTFLPDDGVGAVILTNRNGTMVREALSYTVFDRALGLEPLPWADRLKEREDALRAGMKQAKASRPRQPDAPPTHPLDEYAGTYEHPGYGRIEIGTDGEALTGSWHLGDLQLRHRHYDVFDLGAEDLPDQSVEGAFHTDFDGSIGEFVLAIEPNVAPVVFRRLPEARLSDPTFLDLLTGSYSSNAMSVEVRRSGQSLTIKAPLLGAAELDPVRGTTFRAAAAPGVTVTFELEGGLPVRLLLQPYGIFTRDAGSPANEPSPQD